MEHLKKKKASLTHYICIFITQNRHKPICPLASANAFKEHYPGVDQVITLLAKDVEVFFQEPWGWHFFFSGLKMRFPKICMHLMDCYLVSTFHLRRSLSSGCSKSRELRKATLNMLENLTSKVTRLFIPSCFLSMLFENKGSGVRATFKSQLWEFLL